MLVPLQITIRDQVGHPAFEQLTLGIELLFIEEMVGVLSIMGPAASRRLCLLIACGGRQQYRHVGGARALAQAGASRGDHGDLGHG